MGTNQELEKLDVELRTAEARIIAIKASLRIIELDIAFLRNIRTQLEQNIEVLKSGEVIPAMEEYKKIKSELALANGRLSALQIDHNQHTASLDKAQKLVLDIRRKYATLLKNQDAKVLKGKFSGQK
jgi:chromosome segregation ATPase